MTVTSTPEKARFAEPDVVGWADSRPDPGTSPPLARRLLPAVVLVVVAAVAATLGHAVIAAVAVLVAVLLAQASLLSDAAAARIEAGQQRIGRVIGVVLTAVLLFPVYALLLVPAALVLRALRLDPLESSPGGRSTWRPRLERAARPRRLFANERSWGAITGAPRDRRWVVVRTVVAVLAIEAVAVAAFFVFRDRSTPEEVFEGASAGTPSESAALEGLPWVDEALAEVAEASQGSVYTPATGSSMRDYEGRHVNIDNRVRRSYVTEAPGEPVDVWFFGGSTMFGFDVQRDTHTIPSEVVRLAEAEGVPIRARNYGGPGYTSYQEAQILSLLVSGGEVPDVAVFYDGINDLSLQLLNALVHTDLPGEPGQLQANLVRDALATNEVLPTADPPSPIDPDDEGIVPAGDVSLDELVADVVGAHRQAQNLAETLGRAHGFPVLHYWQPTLLSRDPLDPGEEELLPAGGFDQFRFDAMRALDARVRGELPRDVVDISDAFDGLEGPVFTDIAHHNEVGAAAVARAMYPTLSEVVARQR